MFFNKYLGIYEVSMDYFYMAKVFDDEPMPPDPIPTEPEAGPSKPTEPEVETKKTTGPEADTSKATQPEMGPSREFHIFLCKQIKKKWERSTYHILP